MVLQTENPGFILNFSFNYFSLGLVAALKPLLRDFAANGCRSRHCRQRWDHVMVHHTVAQRWDHVMVHSVAGSAEIPEARRCAVGPQPLGQRLPYTFDVLSGLAFMWLFIQRELLQYRSKPEVIDAHSQ